MPPRSRGAMRPSFVSVFAHLVKRGRRESRVPIAPVGPVQKSTGVGPQVQPETSGFPCAMVYGLLRALPGDRAFLPPSLRRSAPAKLDASVGASGPRDFAVRIAHARLARSLRPPHLTATFVTIASRPSSG